MKSKFQAFETHNTDTPIKFFIGSFLSFFGGIVLFAIIAFLLTL
jgi:hypothetical protein